MSGKNLEHLVNHAPINWAEQAAKGCLDCQNLEYLVLLKWQKQEKEGSEGINESKNRV